MKEWLRKFIRWVMTDKNTSNIYAGLAVAEEHGDKVKPHVKVGVVDVMNGKLLEVTSYKQNSRGPDWTTTYWIMNDSPLAEQIATVIALKGLEK